MKHALLVAGAVALAAAGAVQPAAGQELPRELSGTLRKIKDSGSITIGHREASIPFSYYDDAQKPVGYSVDLCLAVVDRIKRDLALPDLAVRFQPVNASNRLPLVKNGSVDLECGSTANNSKRQEEVAFSVTTFVVSLKFITRTDSGIAGIADLKGRPVAVTQGTNTAAFIRKLNEDRQLGMTILSGKDHAESLLLVETGRAAAFMEDDVLLAGLRANARNPAGLRLLGETFGNDPYALMLRKDDPAFKTLVDSELTRLMTGGAADRIYAKWFLGPIPPNGITIGFAMPDGLKALFGTPSDKATN